MTDLEISKALALAIGWAPQSLMYSEGKLRLARKERQWQWQVFDYRDWNVIGPIAERYNRFPIILAETGKWFARWPTFADTPQKAIALAVIGAAL
jgi:hypothetical protein